MKTIKQFHGNQIISASWALTQLIFIPKIPNPQLINDFRLLALCNVNYKIFSKALANRLKLHLPRIISLEQFAFIQDRNIYKNICIVQELAHIIHNSKARNPTILIKIELRKAFDTTKRKAIRLAMELFNFLEPF